MYLKIRITHNVHHYLKYDKQHQNVLNYIFQFPALSTILIVILKDKIRHSCD